MNVTEADSISRFHHRHLGPSTEERAEMLALLGYASLEDFVAAIVPEAIRRKSMNLPEPLDEADALAAIRRLAKKNRPLRSLIGQGYYACDVPAVITRNLLENPGWYTAYTPYQAEISQGRLEALLNFQTMVSDLSGMEIANASLLDEASAAAEAMLLARRLSKVASHRFLVDENVHPETLAVIRTRAEYQAIEVVVGDYEDACSDFNVFGVLLQYPNTRGGSADFSLYAEALHDKGAMLCVASDLLALTVLKAPGEMGADIVVGNSQRFGMPLGFGGPHAGFMATRDRFKRSMPGRIVGVSRDSRGKTAYRLALQTREQHIRRDKATSNICTAQALPAMIAAAYAVYHGPEGLCAIARRVYDLTARLAASLADYDMAPQAESFFDTLCYPFSDAAAAQAVIDRGLEAGINFRRLCETEVALSLDERSTAAEAETVLRCFSGDSRATLSATGAQLPEYLRRRSSYMTHPVFHRYHSETDMMRYLRRLADYDLALDRTMIPLGSCTMKLNAASTLLPLSWPEFADIHPFVPADQSQGYRALFTELETFLAEITGYDAVSLQPNSGAQGEYAGLLAIRHYYESRGEKMRDICLIPASAHGTNPASARLAGMQIVVVACDTEGNIDKNDLSAKAERHRKHLAAIMLTYPSTHGVFEENICALCDIVHEAGGQVYLDGANFNAQVGLAAPGAYGADVCHLNLHKTFAIPHGGGGPGVGPIAVSAHLAPFLPGHAGVDNGASGGPVSAAPWGSALVDTIAWMYIRMMGARGLTRASRLALLNANYLAARLRAAYPVLYSGRNGLVAHECIVDVRQFRDSAGISVNDIAKRLADFGFHAPTISFPVPGTLMIEPTESESKAELDRLIAALLKIREEIAEVEAGRWPLSDNPLINAPHTLADLTDNWQHPYSRMTAVFPLPDMNPAKYMPPVNRIDEVYGDRHLVCRCPSSENSGD